MISFYFSEAIKSFSRAKFASLITVLSIAISALFTTFALLLLLNSNKITNYLKEKIEITIFLKYNVPDAAIFKLKRELAQDKRIKSAVYKDKETAAREMSQYLGTDVTQVLRNNPLPASFSVHVNSKLSSKQIKKLINYYKQNPNVDDIVFDEQLLNQLLKGVAYVRIFTYSFAIITILLAFYLLMIVNKFSVEKRRELFEIMKLVGAKLSMIRMPVFLSAIILSLLAFLISSAIILLTFESLTKLNVSIFFNKRTLLILNFIVSVLFGIIGGLFSIRNININFTHKKQI